MNKGDVLEVQIVELTAGGMGLARHEGFVIFVPLSAPGDRLKVRLDRVKKSHAFSTIEEIIVPSSSRTTPPCPYFGRCGGCDWQHIIYDEQLRAKQAIVSNHLRHFWSAEIPIIASPREYRYRNRIQLKTQNGRAGYYARGSHELIDIEDCLIAEESLIPGISTLKADSTSKLQNIELRAPDVASDSLKQESVQTDQFAQVNQHLNLELVKYVLHLSRNHQVENIWDLYAGSGNFTIPLAQTYPNAKVYAVEASAKLVQLGSSHSSNSGLSDRVQFYASPVERFVERFELPSNSLIIIDPPRNGCTPYFLSHLTRLNPQGLIYISCNPATLARDLAKITEGGGLNVKSVQAFDMFPQTSHIEVVVELKS